MAKRKTTTVKSKRKASVPRRKIRKAVIAAKKRVSAKKVSSKQPAVDKIKKLDLSDILPRKEDAHKLVKPLASERHKNVDKYPATKPSKNMHSANKLSSEQKKVDKYQIPRWIIKSNRDFYGLTPSDMDMIMWSQLKKGLWLYFEAGMKQDAWHKRELMRSGNMALIKAALPVHLKMLKKRSPNARARINRFKFAIEKIAEYEKCVKMREAFSLYS